MNKIALLAVPLLAVSAHAQTRTFVPNADVANDSIGFDSQPFRAFTPSPGRMMYVQDSQMFLDAGVLAGPIIITEIRIRADNEFSFPDSWTGGTDPNFTLDLSTGATDYLATSLTFDANHGADRARVFSGPLTIPAGATLGDGLPGPFTIVFPLSTPFRYDPSSGNDLVLDFAYSGGQPTGWHTWHDETDSFAPSPDIRGTQLTETTSQTAPVASFDDVGEALCFDLLWNPAAGLFPSFSQDVAAGPSPLTVNFTDTTFTNDPAGVSLVEFDFENDGVFDANTTAGGSVANTYACGTFDVTIRATDTLNGQATTTRTGAVIADEVTLSVAADASLVGAGQTVNFTATATAGATLAWDLDGDGIVDDTTATPSFVYSAGGTFVATCTATLSCNSVTDSVSIDVIAGAVFAPDGGQGFTSFTTPPDAAYFDVNVTNPAGYIVQEIFHRASLTNTVHEMEVYVQTVPGQTVVGNEDAVNFTLVATGTATSPAVASELFRVDVADFVLPPGVTGMAIASRTGGTTWYIGNTGLTSSNADITITAHSSSSNFDTASSGLTDPDSWAGGFIGSPVNDLFPSFVADVTSGLSPLTVNFTDTSVTNDPVGILSWAWDFENDGIVDDTAQNPTFMFAVCGDFDVSLTVIDATNGSRTLVQPGLISTDEFSASFTQDATLVGTGGTVNLTYTGDPAATVSWDFETDGVVDAVGPTAAASYATAGTFTVTMSATIACRTNDVTSTVEVIAGNIIAASPGPLGTTFFFSSPPDVSYMDINVLNPGGITVEELFHRSGLTNTSHDLEVYVQYFRPTGTNIAASNWQLISSGTANSPATADELFAVDVTDFGLPAGVSALAIVTRTGGHSWFDDNAGLLSSDGNVELTPVSSNTNFDTATTATSPDSFSGALIYSLGGGLPGGTTGIFGAGCAGSLGVPDIQPGVQPPQIGTTFAGRVTNVQAGVQIHGGVSRTFNAQFGVPLPFALGPVLGTAADCQFRVSSEVILLAFPNAFGEAVFSFPIPNNPAFQGLIVYIQGLVFDSGAQGGIITSNALFGVVG